VNVLIYGARNSVALFLASFLHRTGQPAVLADTNRFARGFYSRYCRKRYVFRKAHDDREAFYSDLRKCVEGEDIGLVVPTSDQALLDLIEVTELLPKRAKFLFPLDREKILFVMDKQNIAALCAKAGVPSLPTRIIGRGPGERDAGLIDVARLSAPYALKLGRGHSGGGFRKVGSLEELGKRLERLRLDHPGESCLVQEYLEGEVYGAGAISDGKVLRHFYSYRHVRRHPALSGPPTLCQVEYVAALEETMAKLLAAMGWSGYCQMDFILGTRHQVPYLIDVNPVHWYSVPNSLSKELCSLACCLEDGRANRGGPARQEGLYTTMVLRRELQRVLSGAVFPGRDSPAHDGYWHYLGGLRGSDFSWDPLPAVLAPFLKLLATRAG
jgi:predicted ATP-grasp superfamily ATP-dependent carboligase